VQVTGAGKAACCMAQKGDHGFECRVDADIVNAADRREEGGRKAAPQAGSPRFANALDRA